MSLRVVVTVAEGSLEGLDTLLASAGFEVDRRPLLTFGPPESWRAVDQAIRRWSDFSDVVFTSPRAARSFLDRLAEAGSPTSGPSIWASGPVTASELGIELGPVSTVEIRGGIGPGRGLGETMAAAGVEGPVLYVCGEPHREELTMLLRQCDVEVVEAVCYRSVLAETDQIQGAVDATGGGIVVVGSPRVVECLASAHDGGAWPRLVTLGPTTARAATELGWQPAAVSLSPSVEDVARAIEEAAI